MAKATILLVEDTKIQADAAEAMLRRFGYDVVRAEDGMSAIRTVKTRVVDLVLLDLVLPDLDGNEVCRWMKLNPDTRGIPIIMLTVHDSRERKVRGLEAGADDYLPKPYDEVELNARIYACLRTKALQDELREKNRQLEIMLERVELMAITDSLTELFNRRRFEVVLEKEFLRSRRYRTPLSCLMIDVDHFKRLNDEYGHRVGDEVLKEIAAEIRNGIRDVDTAARWGGEEFVVLLPETPVEKAREPALRLVRKIAGHRFRELPPERSVTVSVGLAGVPRPDIETAEKFIGAADVALFEAKREGRNRVVVADPPPAPDNGGEASPAGREAGDGTA